MHKNTLFSRQKMNIFRLISHRERTPLPHPTHQVHVPPLQLDPGYAIGQMELWTGKTRQFLC